MGVCAVRPLPAGSEGGSGSGASGAAVGTVTVQRAGSIESTATSFGNVDNASAAAAAAIAGSAEFEPGESIGDKYEVTKALPPATLGRTYVARSVAHEIQCVFKVVSFAPHTAAVVDTTREEQKVLTRLQHQNVLPVFDVMEDPSHENMIVVTAFTQKGNIVMYAGRLLPDSSEKLRVIAHDVGVGLRVLHSHHLYHHNIKLENVLEYKPDSFCLADGGYSALLSSLSLEKRLQLGNLALTPPEIFAASAVSAETDELWKSRVDIWGFGVVLYHLAFGTAPFAVAGKTVDEASAIICGASLKIPVAECLLPPDLVEIIRWCLEKNPANRPSAMKLLRHPYFRSNASQSFFKGSECNSFVAFNASAVANTSLPRATREDNPGLKIDVVLGKGAHGETFLVHLSSNAAKQFALKGMDTSLARRIDNAKDRIAENEVRRQLVVSRKCRHPCIAPYIEIVEDKRGLTYVTQQYFVNGNITVNYPPHDSDALLVMLSDVLRGVAYLHSQGTYHANLKPANVFYSDDGARFLLTDFGPAMYLPNELVSLHTGRCIYDLPANILPELLYATGLPFVDTFAVGLLAAGSILELRTLVWEQYTRQTDEELDLNRILARVEATPHIPMHLMSFIQTALFAKPTAEQLLRHPLLAAKRAAAATATASSPEVPPVAVSDRELAAVIHSTFTAKEDHRLAGLLGPVWVATTSPATHAIDPPARSVSAVSFDRVSNATAEGSPLATDRVAYEFREAIRCGVCHTELQFLVFRCSGCCDYIRCGKCALLDAHDAAHKLEPLAVESVQRSEFFDDDEEQKCASLIPVINMNRMALEALEMRADLPTGTLSQQQQQQPQPLIKKSSSTRLRKTTSAASSIAAASTPTQKMAAPKAPQRRLLREDEANEEVAADAVIEACRDESRVDLMLNNCALTIVPAAMFDPPLVLVQSLDLSNNAIAELPHEISFLQELRRLCLANNKLTALPDAIGDLAQLQYLDVSHNRLTDLPPSLMFADGLETIAMDYNDCAEFPGCVLDMPWLRVVYLAENRRINKWPPVPALQQMANVKFGLDNEPLLWAEYAAIKDQLSRVTVMWNKIYPDEIVPGLYCGSLRSAQSATVYERLRISYVLTMGRGLEPQPPAGGTHKTVIVDDIEGADIEFAFEDAIAFIAESQAKNAGCLVHCFAGMSRSATTVIAYLMMRKGMRLDEAYCTTKRGRPAIYPNSGFFQQLVALDSKLHPGQRPLDMASMERDKIPCA